MNCYSTRLMTEVTHFFADIFSQICDGNGVMVMWKFNEYLLDVLALPAAVYESPSFPFSNQLANDIFPSVNKLNIDLS